MAAAIETENLTKDFPVGFWRPRPYRALDDLTLQVEAGEVFGFLGPNGAGKSTTLKLLMQLLYPDARAPRRSSAARPAMSRCGSASAFWPRIPTTTTTSPPKSCWRTSPGCSATAAPMSPRGWRACSTKWVLAPNAACGCGSFRKACCSASAWPRRCINDPEVVFLDEPMSGLDPLGRRQVRDLILRLRARGCTVFFSSHILSDAGGALQPGRDPGAGQDGRVGQAHRHPGLRAEGMGARGRQRQRPDARRAREARAARDAAGTRAVHAGSAAGCGAVAPDARAERPRHRGRVAQPGARNARGLLRANRGCGGAAPDGGV